MFTFFCLVAFLAFMGILHVSEERASLRSYTEMLERERESERRSIHHGAEMQTIREEIEERDRRWIADRLSQNKIDRIA